MNAARVAAIAEARSWCGTKFHHSARIKGAGVDCGQLLAAVYHPSEPGPDYPPDWWQHADREILLEAVQAYAREVAAPQPGDLALWHIGRTWSHAGIVTEWPLVVHAWIGVGVLEDDATTLSFLATRDVRFFSPWSDQ